MITSLITPQPAIIKLPKVRVIKNSSLFKVGQEFKVLVEVTSGYDYHGKLTSGLILNLCYDKDKNYHYYPYVWDYSYFEILE